MAEEELAPVEGGEDVVASEEQTPKTIDDYARSRGWKPKEEWDGEGEWRDAETFLSFGLERASNLGKDVKGLKDTVDRMARTQADITAQAVERARKEEREALERRLVEATELGDTAAALEVSQKIAEVASQPVRNGPDPTVENWVNENPWFKADGIANAVAVAASNKAAAEGKSIPEQLEAAKLAVHQRFPEYAPTPAKVVEVAPPTNKAAPNNRKKGFADMPLEAQQVAKELVRRGFAKSVDGYAQNYWNPEGVVE